MGSAPIGLDEIECDIDEDIDNEHYNDGKKIHDSFINKLKDFSTFHPSGNKGKEKGNNSMLVGPSNHFTHKRFSGAQHKDTNIL